MRSKGSETLKIERLEQEVKELKELILRIANSQEVLLDQNGLAELLKVHPSTLHGKTDIYPHTMVGGRRRFFKSRVIEMLQAN